MANINSELLYVDRVMVWSTWLLIFFMN